MKLGMIGLGHMGTNIAATLHRGGHDVIGFDPDQAACSRAGAADIATVPTLNDMIIALPTPRTLWIMVPDGSAIENTYSSLLTLLSPGDIVVDGGNSHYADSARRAKVFGDRRLCYVDAGISGDIGKGGGLSIMLGGDAAAVHRLCPVLETLVAAPGYGWSHVGPAGAGHYAKMVMAGIHAGMMQVLVEGLSLLEAKQAFSFDLHQVASTWTRGSTICSTLLDVAVSALKAPPAPASSTRPARLSSEVRWIVNEAMSLDLPVPLMTMTLVEALHDGAAARPGAILRQAIGRELERTDITRE